ncbi:DMP19 family protein [Chelatococcus reniformis]|uniref:DMP19 family protein n=1 Tax=Chelatococcus reniformis TaxID=1494448 RepID=UPI001667E602|nr:DUF4375 domain-containing protein [Chelatococcus reniformis]
MTRELFAAFLAAPNERFDYWTFLFERNQVLCAGGDCLMFDDPAALTYQALTRPQQVLVLVGLLDSRIRNGGIGQFFFNRADTARPTADAIDALGDGELSRRFRELYDRYAASAPLRQRLRNKHLERDEALARGDSDAATAAYDVAIEGIVGPRNRLGRDGFTAWFLTWRSARGGFLDLVRAYIRGHRVELIRIAE